MSHRSADVESMLPHGPPARLVSTVVDITLDSISCEGLVPARSPYVHEGRCPAFVGLELAAQAAAILEAYGKTRGNSQQGQIGYLVRARKVLCERRDFPADAALRTRVARIGAAPPVFIYEIEVSDSAGCLLRGEISTYVDLR